MTVPRPADATALLPCPFCGESPVNTGTDWNGREETGPWIMCESSRACPLFKRDMELAMWNRRTLAAPASGPSVTDAEVERVFQDAFDIAVNRRLGSSEAQRLGALAVARFVRTPAGHADSSVLIDTLTDVAQLLDGWHQDGTAWSEWDESIRQKVSDRLADLHGQPRTALFKRPAPSPDGGAP